jgi:hypothetical protein
MPLLLQEATRRKIDARYTASAIRLAIDSPRPATLLRSSKEAVSWLAVADSGVVATPSALPSAFPSYNSLFRSKLPVLPTG